MDETIYCKVIYSKGSYNKIRYLKLEDIDDIYDMIKNRYNIYIHEVNKETYEYFN